MIIKLSDNCYNCNFNDQGAIVDASINRIPGAYPAAVYICRDGQIWNLDHGQFQILNAIEIPKENGVYND